MLCDKKFHRRLKGKFYRVAIRLAFLYGTECWPVKKVFKQRMEAAEIRMLRCMCGNIMIDRIRNQKFKEKLKVAPLSAKMCKNRLRWFEHVQRKTHDDPVRKIECIIVKSKRN